MENGDGETRFTHHVTRITHDMISTDSTLFHIISDELARPAPLAVEALTVEIRRRHGNAVAAILFYGSCLRKNTLEGVLDFYVLVDSYRAAYALPLLTLLNAALPPNVFYLEVQTGQQTLRAKYAIISCADFQHAATLRSIHAIVWGRFCQPFVLLYARDEQARATVIHTATEAVLTFVSRAVALLLPNHGAWEFQPEILWQKGFTETYRSELRPEHPATVHSLYEAATERYNTFGLRSIPGSGTTRATPGSNGGTTAFHNDGGPCPSTRTKRLALAHTFGKDAVRPPSAEVRFDLRRLAALCLMEIRTTYRGAGRINGTTTPPPAHLGVAGHLQTSRAT